MEVQGSAIPHEGQNESFENHEDTSSVPHAWLPAIVDRIATCLQANDISCTLRLVNKETAGQFVKPEHKTVRLSQPVPNHAFGRHWARRAATRDLTLAQRRKLLNLTAASGDLANLRVALRRAGCLPNGESIRAAVAAGQVSSYMELAKQDTPVTGALIGMAEGGHVELSRMHLGVFDDLYASSIEHATTRVGIAAAAARNGHVVLARLALNGISRHAVDRQTAWALLGAAAEGCDLAALQLLVRDWQPAEAEEEQGDGGGGGGLAAGHPNQQNAQEPPQQETEDQRLRAYVLASAAGSRTPDWPAKVEWLEAQRGFRRTARAHRFAARAPDALERLAWLRQRGYPAPDMTAVEEAAKAGNAEAVRMLLPEVLPRDFDVREAAPAAAERGHLDVLKVFHAAVTAGDAHWKTMDIAHAAASHGHLPVLEWLMEAYGEEVALRCGMLFCAAAESGSVELMAWLHKHGCPILGLAWLSAVNSGCEAALRWLARRIKKMDHDDPYVTAAEHGDLSTLRCLAQLGWHWDPSGRTFSRCVSKGCAPPVLACLLELGCPVDWDAAEEAARGLPEEAEPTEIDAVRVLTRTAAIEWIAEQRHHLVADG